MPPKSKTSQKKAKAPKYWVGLGASAGGLEALRGFVRNLPPNLSATYIVTQHMAPTHRSMLNEIIGRETSMPVLEVTDNLKPQANTVYITPPNANLVADGDRLLLTAPSRQPAAPKPSIDMFFKSMAKARGEDCIAVVLSGTGSDGAAGIRAVRGSKGITIAQDEMTAKYSSMPVAAVETGCIDLVMSPEELGTQMPKIVQTPRDLNALRASPLNMDSASDLFQLLLDHTKVNFRHYKTATFQRRVERRMAALNVSRLEDYVAVAKTAPTEIEALFRDLLITVTSFFRDPDEFEALRRYVRQIIAEKNGQPIRVWVAGTATGEEAYTIAFIFAEEMGGARAFASARIQIFATDVDADAIEVARRGYYAETTLAEVSEKIVKEYFTNAPAGYSVEKAIRDKIVFSVHNIAQDPPFLNLDLISCRNLLIYFQSQLQAQVFARFHYALVPKGVLFLGKSETVSSSDALFRVADPDKHVFYQRPSQIRKLPRDPSLERPMVARRKQTDIPAHDARDLAVARAQFASLVEAVSPNGLLINSELRIVRAFGNVESYVGLTAGAVDTSTGSLLREPYRQDIRAAVPGVIRRKTVFEGVVRTSKTDPEVREQIMIYPIENGPDDETTALVAFKHWREEIQRGRAPAEARSEQTAQLDLLSEELAVSQSNLRHMVEEMETNNEELQALNEELQSSNEELQSTNEEMETSNEELQSTNEELSTVNEELQVNSHQLNAVNQSLRNILESVAIPMLVVDRDLNITNASRASEKIFGVSPDLALPHVSRCRLPQGFPNLAEVLDRAMSGRRRVDEFVDTGQFSSTLTAVPHFSSSDELVGGIVLLSDNTAELKATRNELQLIFDNLPASILVRNDTGTLIKANRYAELIFGLSPETLTGSRFQDIFDAETSEKLERLDNKALSSGKAILGEVINYVSPKGTKKIINTSHVPFINEIAQEQRIYLMGMDVTDEYEARASLERSEQRLDQAVKASAIGLWDWNTETDALYWSPRVLEILGLKEKDFGGTVADFMKRLHPEDVDRVIKALNDHVASGKVYDIEFRMRHVNGSFRWMQSHGSATRDETGRAINVVGTAQDITAQKRDVLLLRELNEQLVLSSKLAEVGYWKIDLVEETLFWSEEIFKIHGVSPDTYSPELKSAVAFYHKDDVARVQSYVDGAIKSGKPFEFEARIVRPSGSVRYVTSKCSLDIDEANQMIAIFGVFRDITEDRQRENELKELLAELSRSNEELNRFSYVCSHDMKEPVRLIETMSEMLLDPEINADEDSRRELLTRIGNNMKRLNNIIESLLAYSRVDAKIEYAEVDLNAVLPGVLESLSLAVEARGAKIKVNKLPVVTGARVHFIQLFQNLIGNALKYCVDGPPVIKVSSKSTATEHVLRIEDNGPGIPEKARERVFELFGRLQLRDDVDGSGLGLSICRRIVQQYGGEIIVGDSDLGGALFEIKLPKG